MTDTGKQGKNRAARLYAIQALFQMEAAGHSAESVISEFLRHRFSATDENGAQQPANDDLFTAIIGDAVTWQARIDQAADRALVDKWPISRIDPVLRAAFRCAGAELVNSDTPPKVIISEYVALTNAFFPQGPEVRLANAVLDQMARSLRNG